MCVWPEAKATALHLAKLCFVSVALCVFAGCEQQTVQTNPSEVTQPQKLPSKPPASWPPDDRRDHAYVGSLKCAECHQKIYDQYTSSHPMGTSIRECGALSNAAQSSLPASFKAGHRDYRVDYNDGSMTHTEEMGDSSGVIYSRSALVDFAIGSGTRGYSFVSMVEGCMYQSSATWYSQAEKWDLSPGYSAAGHPGFGRRISDDCIFCHAGKVNQAETANRFRSPVFAEASIGCERCHGPGSDHVVFHQSTPTAGLVDKIVNPSALDSSRRDSVCFQCHLHGKNRVLRAGRDSFDFRPGDLISDIWVVLVDDADHTDGAAQLDAVTQSEQMVASACYQNSNGKLGCISCHSPHGTPAPATQLTFYRDRCLNCHSQPEVECSVALKERLLKSKSDSCVQCHMPKAPASDVPHTAQTDHRVLKSYASVGNVDVESTKQGLFESSSFPVPRQSFERAQGLILEQAMTTRQEAYSAMRLLSDSLDSGNDVNAIVAASWTMVKLGRLDDAIPFAMQALEIDPQNESALEVLAIVFQQNGKFQQALKYVQRILYLAPSSYRLQAQKAQILAELDRKKLAISAWLKALEIDPLQHAGRESLIQLFRMTNQSDEAEKHTKILSRIQAVENK